MERERRADEEHLPSAPPHVLAIPYPSQGHVNPMLQFCRRLVSKGVKATLVITNFISKSMNIPPKSDIGFVQIDTISDGFDEGGFMEAGGIVETYLARLQVAGSQTLAQLISMYQSSEHPLDCIVYDAFLPWALDVTKQFGLIGASFFTQPCAVNYIYYHVHHGLLKLPISSSSSSLPVSIPGLPLLNLQDMPSFIFVYGSYPGYFDMVLNQFLNVHKADHVLVNTFYELEDEVVDAMSEAGSSVLTVGPTVPSFYLDKRIENDRDYGLNLFHMDESSCKYCKYWLSTKPEGSVVYVSFGSMAKLSEEQMEELSFGLKESNYCFLWVVMESEEAKLPKKFKEETSSEKGLLVGWSPQLETLSSKAVGCFLSHCGWNSTIEALSLGVPIVAMPQWTDQTTIAKFVQDVWRVGIRVSEVGKNNLVGREEIEGCIREVMEGEKAKEMKQNAIKWRNLAKEAISEGGTSHKNIDDFVSKLKISSRCCT